MQVVVKTGAGKHCKQGKPKISSAHEQCLHFVSWEVKGIELFGLRSPLFCLQLPFFHMQCNAYFREGKIPFRMEIAFFYISQADVLLCQPVYKQQNPG